MALGIFIFLSCLSTDAAACKPKSSATGPGMTTPDDFIKLRDTIKALGLGPAEVVHLLVKMFGKVPVRQQLDTIKPDYGRPRLYSAQDAAIMLGVEMTQHACRDAGLEPPARKTLIKALLQDEKTGEVDAAAVRRIERHGSVAQILSKLIGRDAEIAAMELLVAALPPPLLEQARKIDPTLRSLRFIAVAFLLQHL
jgi:hypothetical protein